MQLRVNAILYLKIAQNSVLVKGYDLSDWQQSVSARNTLLPKRI